MGFLDKAKAAADQLAAKADTAFASSGLGGPGGPDKLFQQLGVIAYLEATGRPVPEGERERTLTAIREAEQRGAVPAYLLQVGPPAPGTVPPPPGAAARMAPPPPPASTPPAAAPPGDDAGGPVPPTAPPPPPPSWA